MSAADKLRMNELILKSLEEDISGKEFAELNRYLEANPENQAYYRQMINMYVELYEGNEVTTPIEDVVDPVLEEQLWQSLAEYEKNAPVMIVEAKDTPETIKIDKSFLQRPRRQIERKSLYAVIVSLAALVFLLVYIKFVPVREIPEPIATLTDCIDVRWANTAGPMEKGTRMSSSQGSLILTKGVAEFLCDDQTKIILEAPAEFEFLRANQVALNYGRLYAVSQKDSVGFTVDTPGSRIVDLGTEFGVKVDVTGITEVHMIKGKASLTISDRNNVKNDVILTENQARRVHAKEGIFKTLTFRGKEFVREINSDKSLIWRGDPMNLADIVGGGNGFGTGVIGSAIDPRTARRFLLSRVEEWGPYEGPMEYMPVTWHDFIDGVFVPDGQNGPVTISTDGRQFASCPDTCNMFWSGISNGGQLPEPLDAPPEDILFSNVSYGSAGQSGIFMHSNLGITFDLDAIRKACPNVTITEFRAHCGICDNGPGRFPFADFWVLIDGRVCFSRKGVGAGSDHEIALPVSDKDRFLTLATTDGGEEVCLRLEGNIPVPIDSDWCLFAEPYLMLELKQ